MRRVCCAVEEEEVEEVEVEEEGLVLPKPLTVLAPVPLVLLFLEGGFLACNAVEEEEGDEEEDDEEGGTGRRRKAWRVGKRARARKRRRHGGGRCDGMPVYVWWGGGDCKCRVD
mgnify:CR=1 FL=1